MPNRSDTKQTLALGEYLVNLYIHLRDHKRVVGARLAERMDVSPPAVTQALRRLSRMRLATLDPEDGVQLTPQGRRKAESILRRHFIIERALVNLLGYGWADSDREAGMLEQALSPELEKFLYERLGRPTTCPHGNPFPGSANEKKLLRARPLSAAKAGETVTIFRVVEEAEADMDLMYFVHDHGLLPGAQVTVRAIDERAGHMALDTSLGQTVQVPINYAAQLRISDPIPT